MVKIDPSALAFAQHGNIFLHLVNNVKEEATGKSNHSYVSAVWFFLASATSQFVWASPPAL